MKLIEKIQVLEAHHFREWYEMRVRVDNELSELQGFHCICGRLATGLHERNCGRFRNKVNSETCKRLKHLWEQYK